MHLFGKQIGSAGALALPAAATRRAGGAPPRQSEREPAATGSIQKHRTRKKVQRARKYSH